MKTTWSSAKLLTSIAAAVALLYCITGFDNYDISATFVVEKNQTEALLKRPGIRLSTELLRDPPADWLFDLNRFNYTLNSAGCSVLHNRRRHSSRIRFAVIVHSKPEHFRQRHSIRTTWASLPNVRTVFLLGNVEPRKLHVWRPDTAALIQAEYSKYGDIVQGNFRDTYKNLTYKHVMGFKWIAEHCMDVDYVIKADDDAFVNVVRLEEFLLKTFATPPEDHLLCNVVPQGSRVLRKGKYSLSEKEFPWRYYPKFCSGLAYVTTPLLAQKLYQASQYISLLRIDDVYVTGLLAESVSANYFYLNLRYSFNVSSVSESNASRFLFGELDTGSSDWRDVATSLWNRSVSELKNIT